MTLIPSPRHAVPRAQGGRLLVLVVGGGVPRTALRARLRDEGWDVRTAADPGAAVRATRGRRPDAAVLDVTRPGDDGVAALGRLRYHLPGVPVLLLTGREADAGRIAGLAAGRDDRVAESAGPSEIAGRLRALVLRAAQAPRGAQRLVVGDLVLHEDRRQALRGGRPIALTGTEFELLRYLMHNPRRVLSKTRILDRLWSAEVGGSGNVVEQHISALRRKIDADRPPMIHTRRGAGYLIKPAEAEPAARAV